VRLEVRRIAQIKNGEKIVGNRTKVKIVKNKVASPFKVAEFDIMYNEGISLAGDLLDTGLATGLIVKTGNTHSYGDLKLGVGRENSKMYIKEHQEIIPDLYNKIREKIATGEVVLGAADDSE
jgi:recombination protein RecA